MATQRDNKVIITAAIIGAAGSKAKHPTLPVTPKEIAQNRYQHLQENGSFPKLPFPHGFLSFPRIQHDQSVYSNGPASR
jgi:hypothetical protein